MKAAILALVALAMLGGCTVDTESEPDPVDAGQDVTVIPVPVPTTVNPWWVCCPKVAAGVPWALCPKDAAGVYSCPPDAG